MRVPRAKWGPDTTCLPLRSELGPRRWVTGHLYPQKTEYRVAEPPAGTFSFVYSGGGRGGWVASNALCPGMELTRCCVPASPRAPGECLLRRR